MPRQPRIVFPGARYHVYDRGNYRTDVFESVGARDAFEATLFEAAARFGWILHAYVVMMNHFHVGLETPRGNLREGMHWLLSTYAIRFNRFRGEQGHVFQGRYHAKLVQSFATLVNYIHLNPVRAGIISVADLAEYRWCSYAKFIRGARPDFLSCREWLNDCGGLQDSPAGWRSYADYLAALTADTDEQQRQGFDQMCQGWAHGTREWKKDIADKHVEDVAPPSLAGSQIAELKEAVWAKRLDALLASAAKTRADAAADRYGAPWKIEIAELLRNTTTATNEWIARELVMGCRSSVAVYLSQRRRRFKN